MPEKEALTTGIKLWQFVLGLGGTILPVVYFFGKKTQSFEAADGKLSEQLILLEKRMTAFERAQYITIPHHDNLQKICQQEIKGIISDETHAIIIKSQETVNEIKLDIRDMKSDIKSLCTLIQERKH